MNQSPWSDLPADILGRALALLPPVERRAARASCSSWRVACDERWGPSARPLLPLMVAAAAAAASDDSDTDSSLGRALEATTASSSPERPPSFPAVHTLLIPAVRDVGGGAGLAVAAAAPFPPSTATAAPSSAQPSHIRLATALAHLYPRAERADLSGWRGPGALDVALALHNARALDLGGATLLNHRAAVEAAATTTPTTTVPPLPALALKTRLRRLSLAGSRLEAQARGRAGHAGSAPAAAAAAQRAEPDEAALALLALRGGLPRLRALDLGRLPPDKRAGWPLNARGLLEGGDDCGSSGRQLPPPSLRDRAIAGKAPFAPSACCLSSSPKTKTLCVRYCCALLPPQLTRLDLLLQPLTMHDVRDICERLGPNLRSLSLSWGGGGARQSVEERPGDADADSDDPLARPFVLASRAAARAFDAAVAAAAAEKAEAAVLRRKGGRGGGGGGGGGGNDNNNNNNNNNSALSAAINAAWQARAAKLAALETLHDPGSTELEGEDEDEDAFSEDAVRPWSAEDEHGNNPRRPRPPPPLTRLFTHLGSLPHLRRLELHLPSADIDLGGWPPAPMIGLTRLHPTLEDLTLGCCPSSAVALSLAALTRLTALRLVGAGGDADARRRPTQQQHLNGGGGDAGPFGSPDDWMGGSVAVTAQAVAHVVRSLPRLRLLRVSARLVGSGLAPPGDELLSQLLFAGAGAEGLRVMQLPSVPLHGTGLTPPGGEDEVAGLASSSPPSSSSSSSEELEDEGEVEGDYDDDGLDQDGRGRGCCWSDDDAGDGDESSGGGGERGDEEEDDDDDAAKARPRSPPFSSPPPSGPPTGPAPWARAGAVPLPTNGDDDEQQQRHRFGASNATTAAATAATSPAALPTIHPPKIARLELDASVLMHGSVRSLRRLRRSLRALTLWRSDAESFASACQRRCYAVGVGALSRLTSLRVVAPAVVAGCGRDGGEVGGGTAATWPAAAAVAVAGAGAGAGGAAIAPQQQQQQQQQGPAPMEEEEDDENEDSSGDGGSWGNLIDASDGDDADEEDEDEEEDDAEPPSDGGAPAWATALAEAAQANADAPFLLSELFPLGDPAAAATAYFEPHLHFLASLPKLRVLELTSLRTLLSAALRPLSALPHLRRCALGGALALDQAVLAAASTAARWPRLRVLVLSGVNVVMPPFRPPNGAAEAASLRRGRPRPPRPRRHLVVPKLDDLLLALLDRGSGDNNTNTNNKPQLEAVDLRWGVADAAVAEALERAQAMAAGDDDAADESSSENAHNSYPSERAYMASFATMSRASPTQGGLREAVARAPRSLRYLRLVGASLLPPHQARRALADSPLVWAENVDADAVLPVDLLDWTGQPGGGDPLRCCLPDEAIASDGAPRRRLGEWRFVRLPTGTLVDAPFFMRRGS